MILRMISLVWQPKSDVCASAPFGVQAEAAELALVGADGGEGVGVGAT